MSQFIIKWTRLYVTKCDSFITEGDSSLQKETVSLRYETVLLQNATVLLQTATVIKKCDDSVLQNMTVKGTLMQI